MNFDVDIGGDVPFQLALTGYSGNLKVVKLPPVCRQSPLDNLSELVLVSYHLKELSRAKVAQFLKIPQD